MLSSSELSSSTMIQNNNIAIAGKIKKKMNDSSHSTMHRPH